MNNTEFGELHILEDGKMKIKPTYTCGHCSDVVVMNPNRTREREKCYKCQRFLCATKAICREQCTPLHSMARDHFEGAGEFGRLVPAIMQGCSTVDEANTKGLIITNG